MSEYTHTLSFWWATAGMPYLLGKQQAYRGTSREDIGRYLRRYLIGQPFIAVALAVPDVQKNKLLNVEDLLAP
ncbi:MAG: hypothetical protein EXS42_06965 [Lacunisphaera sp.]|nr:hypothetical protein [Lacunisphaera sp.]